jgi:hypothetical protein
MEPHRRRTGIRDSYSIPVNLTFGFRLYVCNEPFTSSVFANFTLTRDHALLPNIILTSRGFAIYMFPIPRYGKVSISTLTRGETKGKMVIHSLCLLFQRSETMLNFSITASSISISSLSEIRLMYVMISAIS